MASLVNDGNINWTGNWQTVGKADTIHASTNLNVDSGSPQYSGYWTGNASNTDIGCVVYFHSENNAGAITATLQSATDTAFTTPTDEQTSTFTIDSTTLASTYIFFKLSSSEAEDGVTPRYYRYKFTSNNAADTYFRADNAATTKVAILQVLSTTATIATNDITYIVGNANGATGNPAAATVTMNENSSTAYGIINIENAGTLSWSTGATTALTITGLYIYVRAGGIFSMGTSGTPIGSAYTATLTHSPSSNGAIYAYSGSTINIYGASKTYYKTTLSSAITANDVHFHTNDTTGWAVGDEIVVTTTSATRGETEKVTITGISGTTIYIDSNGDGTAATPKLTYAHDTSAYILNISRNATITSNGTNSTGFNFISGSPTFNISWGSIKAIKGNAIVGPWNSGTLSGVVINNSVFRDTAISAAGGSGTAITANNGNNSTNAINCQNTIFYNNGAYGLLLYQLGAWNGNPGTYNYIYAINNAGTGISLNMNQYSYQVAYPRLSITNSVAIANATNGIEIVAGGWSASASNIVTQANTTAGLTTNTTYEFLVDNHISGYNKYGCWINGYGQYTTIIDRNSKYGSDGVNSKANVTYDIACGDSNYANGYFVYVGRNILTTAAKINPYYGSNVYNPLSRVTIGDFGQTAGRHYAKRVGGVISDQVTGGQAASWARGGSGICVYLDPSSTTKALEWEFYVPVTASTSFQLSCYVKTTQTSNGPTLTCTIYDSDDDNTVLLNAESVTLTSASDWTAYTSTACNPTVTGFCRVLFSCLNGSSTGDVGIDDVTTI